MRVHDGNQFSSTGLIALIARTEGIVRKAMRERGCTLQAEMLLVGFWTECPSHETRCVPMDLVHIGEHALSLEDELRRMTGRGIGAHVKDDRCIDEATYWGARFDEIIIHRDSLPTHAYHRAWSNIPQNVKDKAVGLMRAYSDDQTLASQRFWKEQLEFISLHVMGKYGEKFLSTEVPVLGQQLMNVDHIWVSAGLLQLGGCDMRAASA